MQLLAELPRIERDTVDKFLAGRPTDENDRPRGRRTRSSLQNAMAAIVVDELRFEDGKRQPDGKDTVRVLVSRVKLVKPEPPKKKKAKHQTASEDTHGSHSIRTAIATADGEIRSAVCIDCDDAKVKCQNIAGLLYWLQRAQLDAMEAAQQENAENAPGMPVGKLEKLRRNILKPDNHLVPMVLLTKIKDEPASPMDHETAGQLSMLQLINSYRGNDPVAFLQHCTERMPADGCSMVEQLTVEQADTDLWHELRKGRITASRMHEASRCTMVNGSLTGKIMGISSGFSFAMKRGTELEGHVFRILQRQYPSLRNVGLVLDRQFPWMGASPDGMADDFVLEIKCPYTEKTHACYVDVTKLSRKYFAQIQLQMHMTHRTKALLGVAALDFEQSQQVTQVWIDYDRAYVDEIMAESFEFWRKGVFPALLRKRKTKQ